MTGVHSNVKLSLMGKEKRNENNYYVTYNPSLMDCRKSLSNLYARWLGIYWYIPNAMGKRFRGEVFEMKDQTLEDSIDEMLCNFATGFTRQELLNLPEEETGLDEFEVSDELAEVDKTKQALLALVKTEVEKAEQAVIDKAHTPCECGKDHFGTPVRSVQGNVTTYCQFSRVVLSEAEKQRLTKETE
jgi:hypothetical protein